VQQPARKLQSVCFENCFVPPPHLELPAGHPRDLKEARGGARKKNRRNGGNPGNFFCACRGLVFTPLRSSSQSPCNSSAKPPTPLSPNRGTSEPSASPMSTASCLWCSAVTCLACLPLQRASTPHARVPAASGARLCPHQRFHIRLAGAAVGIVCVGRRLGSDCVLPSVVRFC
jgi:hypothetical protein